MTRVTDAAFTGRVTFDEEGLNARAADVRYQPRMNSLQLSGADARRRSTRLGRSDFHRRAHDRRRAGTASDRRHRGEDDAEPAEGIDSPRARARQAASRSLDSCVRTRSRTSTPTRSSIGAWPGRPCIAAGRSLWQGETTIRAGTSSAWTRRRDAGRHGRQRAPRWNSIRVSRLALPTRSATTTTSVS